MYKVVIADDRSIVRAGLHILLDSCGAYAVMGEAASGTEAIEQTLALAPDLLLTDLKMPGTSIIEGAKTLKDTYPHMKIIILTAFDESEDIYRAFKAGVDGYLMKDTSPEVILAAIDDVMKGASCFQPKDSGEHSDFKRSSFQ
ncbi:response regulator transcription factor [Paenibacillus sp. GCM10023248]|uniref:response regulator n=1 Tax=Bacillales TaxID=1385 RepID=UPI00237995D7|nr:MULTISPECIES: response regulator transcription factor [Bacillales]MDD9270940.1 response regulator transcription factor [Paenibacillus sp. MAHUQ-63]MDR6882925.1 DNA-binding NarL/FixJ family response regulator [Bacillus sp. 3255]